MTICSEEGRVIFASLREGFKISVVVVPKVKDRVFCGVDGRELFGVGRLLGERRGGGGDGIGTVSLTIVGAGTGEGPTTAG